MAAHRRAAAVGLPTLLAVGTALLCIGAVASAAEPEDTVRAAAGTIVGRVSPFARSFRGIPFAQPPVGALRWNQPQPMAPWTTPLSAFRDAPGCPQDCQLPEAACPPAQSEDCLFLNVFTPRASHLPAAGAPVMVFFHGGNFKQGYAGGLLYDGTSLANRTGVVVVVAQYRLGVLGFLNTGDTIRGNYGLYDQQQALRWVQDNIAAFGGDRGSVTIFGQSAGAMSVASHLVMNASRGLFHKAIMESEPFALTFRTEANFHDWSATYAGQYAKCPNPTGTVDDCLRGLDYSHIVAAQAAAERDVLGMSPNLLHLFLPWTPTVGGPGSDLPLQPMFAFNEPSLLADVPIMAGTVENEGLLFVDEAFTKDLSPDAYALVLDFIFSSATANATATHYAVPANASDARPELSLVATDALFKCATRNATLAAAGHSSDVFVYNFNHVMKDASVVWGPRMAFCDDSVCHSAELPFVFHPNVTLAHASFTAAELQLSESMQDYWSRFARTGAPGAAPPSPGAAPLLWPAFNASTQTTMTFATPNVVEDSEYAAKCGFWEAQGWGWLLKP